MRPKLNHTLGLTLLLLLGCGVSPLWSMEGADPGSAASNVVVVAETNLKTARIRYVAETTNSVAAWELGRACLAWGLLLKEPTSKEKIFSEGIAACRRSLTLNPKSGPAHYYLGMNIGRVADLKRNLAAYAMVKEVEKAFQHARELDKHFAYAGSDRNLGLLYQHAPGWPFSLGNRKLARKHHERAVKLAPDYPENRLNLAEAYREWDEPKLFQQQLDALQQLWPRAKTNWTGAAWAVDWADWENRRAKLLASEPKLK